MKQKRHTPEEIIKKLREAEALIAAGKGIDRAERGIMPRKVGCGVRSAGIYPQRQRPGIRRPGGQAMDRIPRDQDTLHRAQSTWQNSCMESFNARFRDEFLNVELFSSKLEAKVLSAEHREKYSNQRPHSSLRGMTLGEFAARCLATLRPPAYAAQDSEINPKHQQFLS